MKFLGVIAAAAGVAGLAYLGTRKRGRPALAGTFGEGEESSCSTKSVANVRTCITRPKKLGPVITGPAAACRLLANAKGLDRESLFTVALNPQLKVLGVEETAKGQVDAVAVAPREIFKAPIMMGASAIMIAHNHPSGDPSPSKDDHDLTRQVKQAGEKLGIPLVDHIVIGEDSCTSIRDTTKIWE